MKILKCHEVLDIACNHVVKASSDGEAIRAMLLHSKLCHKGIFADMDAKSRDRITWKMLFLIKDE